MRKPLTPERKKILEDRFKELMPERQALVSKIFLEGLSDAEKERLRKIHADLDDLDMELFGPMLEAFEQKAKQVQNLADQVKRLQTVTEETIRVCEEVQGDPVRKQGLEDGLAGEEPTSQSPLYQEAYRMGKELESLWEELEDEI